MKKLLFAFVALLTLGSLSAQDKKPASPPATMEANIAGATIEINYSQPSVKGREIYGELVPFDKVWRTGANKATSFKTDKDININGKMLKAGEYALYTIPGEKEWTVIFNTDVGAWGAYKYSEEKDVLRVSATPEAHDMTEVMTFTPGKNVIYLDWAETRVPLKIKG